MGLLSLLGEADSTTGGAQHQADGGDGVCQWVGNSPTHRVLTAHNTSSPPPPVCRQTVYATCLEAAHACGSLKIIHDAAEQHDTHQHIVSVLCDVAAAAWHLCRPARCRGCCKGSQGSQGSRYTRPLPGGRCDVKERGSLKDENAPPSLLAAHVHNITHRQSHRQ